MKPIVIRSENSAKIEAALAAVNRQASVHTYTTAAQIVALADYGEASLERLRLPVKARPGAAAISSSGEPVANSYRYWRIGTCVTLRRRSKDWYLDAVEPATLYNRGGQKRLVLTPEQDANVVERFRARYTVSRDTLAA